MGKGFSTTELGAAPVTGTFVATGSSASIELRKEFNASVWGTFVATVTLERTFDAGTTWLPVTYSDGTAISWAAPTSGTWSEPERGVLYRVRCTAYTSGTVSYRISQ